MSTDILANGKTIIQAEADALKELASALDDNFLAAVKSLLDLSSNGHVIVSGMGKAGLIGMKISATLASIGTPSFFLHPAEALHGDIGRYTKNDIALIISNSGETEEITKMIPAIKRIGCPILSITAVTDSSLAQHSNVSIAIGTGTEAGHLGLAPTTSTIKMLAIGDALAMALLKEKDLSPQDFAFYHPGGNLGKALIKASEIMRTGNRLCIASETASVREVVKAYSSTEGRPGAAAIVDSEGKLSGVFTDGDLRRLLDLKIEQIDAPVKEIMGTNPKTIQESDLAADALRVLSENKIDQVIVTNQSDQPTGMIDIQDVCLFLPEKK